ncbi:unnamed protein product [Cuscuta epithymum]|uniref:Uncharacterized protein n=1 Tax=Cuscuta epithymum TaxID=186058 RepID=A0AAV0DGK2_9ASTE|nr:unnamed protein product [Cuscuta epithymum]
MASIPTSANLLGRLGITALPSRASPPHSSVTYTTRIHIHCFRTRSSLTPAFLTFSSDPCLKRLRLFEFGSIPPPVSAISNGSSNAGSGHGGSGNCSTGGGGGCGSSGDGRGGDSTWSFLTWYLSLLEKYPVWTKAISSALLNCIGDFICQLLTDHKQSFDGMRTFRFTFLGLVLVGPSLHIWYLYLSRLVTTTGASGAFLRLLLDQLIFAPFFIGVFLSTLATLEGQPSHVIPKLQQVWSSAVLANWQLWIPFQFFNFRFVPQQFQVLAANFISLIWNMILSYKAHKDIVVK